MDEATLSASNVQRILLACLIDGSERLHQAVIVQSVIKDYLLSAARLATYRSQVHDILKQLPAPFRIEPGCSFMHAYYNGDGEQWTKEEHTVDQLCALGIGLGAVTLTPERERWRDCPMGLPYVVVIL